MLIRGLRHNPREHSGRHSGPRAALQDKVVVLAAGSWMANRKAAASRLVHELR